MTPHVHVSAVSGLTFLAWLIVFKFLVHTFAGLHADNAALQGLAYNT